MQNIQKELNWEEATQEGLFVNLKDKETKTMVITNWKLYQVEKEFNGQQKVKAEFRAEVIELDGQSCQRVITTTNGTFKKDLRGILQGKDPSDKVKIKVRRIGSDKQTVYLVEEVKQ